MRIDDYAFGGCSNILEINIPEGVNFIGGEAFSGCTALREVKFADNNKIDTINYDTFLDCYALTVINLPNTITEIGSNAFENCTCLVGLKLPTALDSIGSTNTKRGIF